MKQHKNKLVLFIVGLLISITAVSAGVTISLVYNKTVEGNVSVGETVKYSDGLIIELIDYDTYTLTYLELDETSNQKHYVTYTYSYEFIDAEFDINVSSLSDDIVIINLDSDDSTISITFMMNQDKTYNEGDLLHIEFYFEGVEQIEWYGYTVDNPININTATQQELEAIGFTTLEAYNTVQARSGSASYDGLNNLGYRIGSYDMEERYQQYVDDGYIIFN